MKLFTKIKNHTNFTANALACFAMTFVVASSKGCCFFIFHQPKMPDEVVKLNRAKYE